MRVVNQTNLTDDCSPRFLHVSFADSPPQVNVSRLLPPTWAYLPPGETDSGIIFVNLRTGSVHDPGEVVVFVKDGVRLNDEEIVAFAQNPDQDSIHTPWRDGVYEMWNHVFYDVANVLQAQFDEAAGVAHFHPPSTEALRLDFPINGPDVNVTKIWETDVLICPAHLKSGVTVRVSVANPSSTSDSEDSTAFTFDGSTHTDVVYIRRGTEANFTIQGKPKGDSKVAAVMVGAIMCSESHDPDDPLGRPEQRVLNEDETTEADLQVEVQSSVRSVLAMAAAYRAREAGSGGT